LTRALEHKISTAAGAARRWGWRSLLAIVDQGLISGANFVLVILFARWLSPPEYGAVSVALSVFLLVANVHHAVVLEPMSVLGPRHFPDRLPRYFRTVLRAHLAAVTALALALVGASLLEVRSTPYLTRALAGLALSTPMVLTFWLLRRLCYVNSDPRTALRGGGAFLTSALLGAFLVRDQGWQSPASLFLITAAAALCAAAVLTGATGLRRGGSQAPPAPSLRETLQAHWTYGRWMLGVSLTYWLANSALPVLLALSAGLAGSAELRAVENLVTPILQATGALSLLLLPWVSGQTQALGPAYLRRFHLHGMLAAVSITGGYLVPVVLLRGHLMEWIYGPGAYTALAGLVPVVALATMVRGISDLSLSTALKGAARPEAHFYATVGSSAFVLTGGWWLIRHFGVTGAALTMLASNLTQAAVLALFYLRLTRRLGAPHAAD